MRYAKIYKSDISNGPGFRVSLFTQGCTHCCEGCFNPETWDITCGKEWTDEVDKKILGEWQLDYISGLSILGGDPLVYYEDEYYEKFISNPMGDEDRLLKLVKMLKFYNHEKTIWLWTGYLWEDFFKDDRFSSRVQNILPYIDVIVDGPFIQQKYDRHLKYSGSTNQRVIDVHASLCSDCHGNKIVLYNE